MGEIEDGGVGSPIATMMLTASLDTSVAGSVAGWAIEQGARGGALHGGSDARDHCCDKGADRRPALLVGSLLIQEKESACASGAPISWLNSGVFAEVMRAYFERF